MRPLFLFQGTPETLCSGFVPPWEGRLESSVGSQGVSLPAFLRFCLSCNPELLFFCAGSVICVEEGAQVPKPVKRPMFKGSESGFYLVKGSVQVQ